MFKRQIVVLNMPALGDNDFRMAGGQPLFVVGVQFLEHFLTRPQTHYLNTDIQSHTQSGKAYHIGGEIDNPDWFAHIQQQDLAVFSDAPA